MLSIKRYCELHTALTGISDIVTLRLVSCLTSSVVADIGMDYLMTDYME